MRSLLSIPQRTVRRKTERATALKYAAGLAASTVAGGLLVRELARRSRTEPAKPATPAEPIEPAESELSVPVPRVPPKPSAAPAKRAAKKENLKAAEPAALPVRMKARSPGAPRDLSERFMQAMYCDDIYILGGNTSMDSEECFWTCLDRMESVRDENVPRRVPVVAPRVPFGRDAVERRCDADSGLRGSHFLFLVKRMRLLKKNAAIFLGFALCAFRARRGVVFMYARTAVKREC